MRYDSTAVPERYHRSRALTSADVDRWVRLVQEVLPRAGSTLLIDLGCGTGRFTVPLAEQLGVSVIGVDPSQKMLQEAARHTRSRRIAYREGRAEAIPLGANVAALIFMSNAIHHVTSLDEALQEMWRVLQPQGIVFIRNYSLENLQSLPYLEFFPKPCTSAEQCSGRVAHWLRISPPEALPSYRREPCVKRHPLMVSPISGKSRAVPIPIWRLFRRRRLTAALPG